MTAHQDVAGLVSRLRANPHGSLHIDTRAGINEPTSMIEEAADRLESLSQALREAEAERWQSIDTAPKDGTHILVWFIHANARYSKDPVAEGWACAHEAHWIDHNGGGWTWYGLCGVATYWQPLPKPPSTNKEDGK